MPEENILNQKINLNRRDLERLLKKCNKVFADYGAVILALDYLLDIIKYTNQNSENSRDIIIAMNSYFIVHYWASLALQTMINQTGLKPENIWQITNPSRGNMKKITKAMKAYINFFYLYDAPRGHSNPQKNKTKSRKKSAMAPITP